MVDRFSRSLHLRAGKLGNWHESQGVETRHRHLRAVAKKDGWAEVSLRLNVLANLSHRKHPANAAIAREDQRWAAGHETGSDLRSE